MARKSNFIGRNIPSLSTRKSAPVTTNFAKGIYTYKPNDTMDSTEIRLAQDARFDRVGEYGTRLGYKILSAPLGKGTIYDNRSQTTPAAYTTANNLSAVSFTASASFTLCSISVWPFVVTRSTYSVGKITVYVNGEVATQAYFVNDSYQSAQQKEVYFVEAPSITNGDAVKIVITSFRGGDSELGVRINPGTTTPYIIVTSCTPGGVGNVFESNINGIKTVFYTQNGSLYRYTNGGSPTIVRALPAGVTKVRFSQNLNVVRYVDGKEGPRSLTPTISGDTIVGWTDAAIPVKDLKTDTTLNVQMSNIMNGTADNLIYFAVDPDTEALWTYPYGYTYAKSPAFSTTATINGNPGTTLSISSTTITPSGIAVGDWITGQGTATAEVTSISGTTVNLRIVDTTPQSISSYDKFSVDFYQNFPAIKTGDPLTAMFNLGGVLYFMTRRNKYQMYAQSADSWTQSASNAQNGTFSQESVVCDLNYAYFANDNGIYIFDGASEASITEGSIQNVYDAIPNKEKIVVELYKNRLYVYYPSTSGGPNDHCLVYNINLKVWESFDSNTFVSATSARQNTSGRFICGHSKIGMLMINEDATNNNYSDIGTAIAFNLETAYQHFGTTSQQKRITKWRPEFATTTKPYTVECGYSLDYTDQVEYAFSIDLLRQAPTYVGKNIQGGYKSSVSQSHNGITFVNNADGTFTISAGTATGGDALSMFGSTAESAGRFLWLAAGTYTLSGGTALVTLQVIDQNGNAVVYTSPKTGAGTFTINKLTQVFVRAAVNSGKTVPNTTIYAQLESGPYVTNYMPYSVWNNPPDYGVPAIPTRHTTRTKVNGEFYRCQIRYQHIAAFEPVIFRSHTLTIETQRIR